MGVAFVWSGNADKELASFSSCREIWDAMRGQNRPAAKMAGCYGVKKQKLNNALPAICCNGSVHPNNCPNGSITVAIVRPEMCFFCFDVLYSHLHNCDSPKTPCFTNDS